MKEKYIVCLANSAKYSGRCLSGIELEKRNGDWNIVYDSLTNPKWIRPISRLSKNGEIPENQAEKFKLFDIIKLENVEECPSNAHNENVYHDNMVKVGSLGKDSGTVDRLCDKIHNEIFYDGNKAISSDVFEKGNYSLMLIKPQTIKFIHSYDEDKERDKFRADFTYNGLTYSLPVTDKIFMRVVENQGENMQSYLDKEYNSNSSIYLVISLGLPFNGNHYKLVAGVIKTNK
jgi:hypothetical protein